MPGNGALPSGTVYRKTKGGSYRRVNAKTGALVSKKSKKWKQNKAARQAAFEESNRKLTVRNRARIRRQKIAATVRKGRVQRARKGRGRKAA